MFPTDPKVESPRSKGWQVRFHHEYSSLGFGVAALLSCAHLVSSLCLHGERSISLSLPLVVRPTFFTGLGFILMNSFNLNYLLKGLSPKIMTLGVRVSTQEFVGDTVQPIAPGYHTTFICIVSPVCSGLWYFKYIFDYCAS